MKTTKPLLEDKLVTWKRAYAAVLAELTHPYTLEGDEIFRLRIAAARTAAVLIQGVEHGDSSTD